MPWWAVTSIVAACLVIGGIAGYLVYTTNLHAPAQVATTQPAGEASTPLPTTNVSPTARPVDEREIARAASDGDKHRNPDKPPSQPNAKPSDTARNGKGNDGQTQQGTPATKPEAPDKKGFATPANLIAQKSPSQPTINPSPTEPTPAATAAQPLKMVALDDSSIINDGKDPPLVLRITEAPPTTCDKDGRWTPGGNNLPPLENVQTLSMAWKDNSTQCNVDGKSLTTIQLRVRGNGRTMELYTAANDSKDDTSPKTILRVVFDGKVLNYYWKDKDQGSKYVIPQVSTCVFVLKDAQKHTVAKVRFGDAVREVTLNQDAAAPANPLPIPSGITLKDLVLTDNLEDTRWKHDGGKSAASNAALTSAYQTTGKSVAFSTGTSEKLFDGRGVPSANTGGTPVQGYSERPTFKVTAAIAEKGEKEKQQVLELSWDWPNIDRKKKKEQYETDLKCTKLEDMEKYNVNPNDQSSRTIVGQMVALGKVNASNLKTKKQIEEDVKRASRPLNEREQKFMDGIKPEHDKLQTQFDDLRKQLKAEQKDFLTRWWIKPFDITVRLKNGLDLAVVHVKLDDSWNPERSVAP